MYKSKYDILNNYPNIYNTIEDMKAQTWGFDDEQTVLNFFRKDPYFLKHLRIETIKVVLDERDEFQEDELLKEFIADFYKTLTK
jgi:hypothetical protein